MIYLSTYWIKYFIIYIIYALLVTLSSNFSFMFGKYLTIYRLKKNIHYIVLIILYWLPEYVMVIINYLKKKTKVVHTVF